jgi:hypothetical protein
MLPFSGPLRPAVIVGVVGVPSGMCVFNVFVPAFVPAFVT